MASNTTPLTRLANELRAEADKALASYPQYNGKHDDWAAARTTRRIETKSGFQAEIGEIVIAKPYEREGQVSWTFWSRRTKWHVGVPESYLTPVTDHEANAAAANAYIRAHGGLIRFEAF